MRDQAFASRITALLGIRHPILCGGLGPGVADAAYVAAVVNAGGMGFLVSSGFPEPGQFQDELRRCRELTGGKPFGVNLYVSRLPGSVERITALIPCLADAGVGCVETAGASPEPFLPLLREAGIRVLHKAPGIRYAQTAQRLGVDAVILVGAECGGHPGTLMIGSMVQAAQAAALDIPVVIGGGIGTGAQLAAVLAMGGDGVLLGTRMLVARELWIHEAHKRRIVAADGTESVIVKRLLRQQQRVLNNDGARAVLALEAAGVTDFEAYREHVQGSVTRQAYTTGDARNGMLDFGQAAVFATAIESVEEIFDRMIDEALAASGRLAGHCVRQAVPA